MQPGFYSYLAFFSPFFRTTQAGHRSLAAYVHTRTRNKNQTAGTRTRIPSFLAPRLIKLQRPPWASLRRRLCRGLLLPSALSSQPRTPGHRPSGRG